MLLKLVIILTIVCYTLARNDCLDDRTLKQINHKISHFTNEILRRTAWMTHGHFAVSPLATWLQLAAIAEGAEGKTYKEIATITGIRKNKCFQEKVTSYLKKIKNDFKLEFKSHSLIIIDELLEANVTFCKKIQDTYGVKVIQRRFYKEDKPKEYVNKEIQDKTNEVIQNVVSADDFNGTTMVVTDNVYFRTAWLNSFPEDDIIEDFYDKDIGQTHKVGKVSMMRQIGYFNTVSLPNLNAKVIEIPCISGFSMLVFLPTPTTEDLWVNDIINRLPETTLDDILASLTENGLKLIDLKLPRFKVRSKFNMTRILNIINVTSVFDVRTSELTGISEYPIYVNPMTHTADIEIVERGASSEDPFMVNDIYTEIDTFVANRPFVYLIVDRNNTQFIPFGGAYSKASVVKL